MARKMPTYMRLQKFQIHDGVSFTIMTENIVFGTPLKVLLHFNEANILVKSDAAVALFSCYERMKYHFGCMAYIGQIDYIVHKSQEDCERNYWVCTSVEKTCLENGDVTRQFKLCFYDFFNGGWWKVPCDRGLIRLMYHRRMLIRNAIQFWENKMGRIAHETAVGVRANHPSLLLECKRSLLNGVPELAFVPREYLNVMPTGVSYYLRTWSDDGPLYTPTPSDYANLGVDRDTDDLF